MNNKRFIRILALILTVLALAGCTPSAQNPVVTAAPAAAVTPAPVSEQGPAASPAAIDPDTAPSAAPPKYIFLFIGDGMSFAQISAAQYFIGSDKPGDISLGPLSFTRFPVTGIMHTHNVTSVIPDSASSGTAMACGVRTQTGMLGQTADGQSVPTIAQMLHAAGKRIGIVSSVTLNNATPAAFYAHAATRTDYAGIAQQMAQSGFEYFAGGAIYSSSEKDGIARDYSLFKQQGYTVVDTQKEILALGSDSGKVYAVSPTLAKQGAMPFAIDAHENDFTLADFVSAGISVLDNENGFFMMCEGGKIDWACHAHDAAAAVKEVLAFADAVGQAVDFAAAHPDETLILVTADHETGGMSVGSAAMGYETNLGLLDAQQVSYSVFNDILTAIKSEGSDITLASVMPAVKQSFGLIAPNDADASTANAALVLSDEEYKKLQRAFNETVKPAKDRTKNEETALLYGGYEPLTVTLTHILGSKAGIGWTSYAHTGLPVPVYAMGAGAPAFGGSYDNTGLFDRLVAVSGLPEQINQ